MLMSATYRGKPAGSFADMSIYSFHPVKSITTGEGGAVVTDNPEYALLVKLFRTHGITKDAVHLKNKKEGGWYMEQRALKVGMAPLSGACRRRKAPRSF